MIGDARIRPEALQYVLLERLNRGMRLRVKLWEAEQPRITFDLDSTEIIGHFLIAVRSVYAKAETFYEGQTDDRFRSSAWYKGWLAGLTPDQDAIWRRLREERAAEEHGEGAALIQFNVDVSADPSITLYMQPIAGAEQSKVWKPVARFAADPNRPTNEVCAEYLGICQLFVHDFLRDHGRLPP